MTTLPEGGVVITLADVYRTVLTLTGRVDAALSRQEQIDRAIADHKEDTKKAIADHESRLRTIERSRWPMASLMMLVAMISAAAAVLALVLKAG